MLLSILILSFGLFSSLGLFAKERSQEMGIVLVSIGEIDRNVMDWLRNDLNKVFGQQVFIGKEMAEPDDAYYKKSNQYLSTTILNALMEQKEYTPYGAPRASPWSPKTIPTYARASVGHPPVSEIRRSMID